MSPVQAVSHALYQNFRNIKLTQILMMLLFWDITPSHWVSGSLRLKGIKFCHPQESQKSYI